MPTRFRPYHPDQGLLLPSNMRDWLSEGHLAHHVSDLVDGLDLTAFYAQRWTPSFGQVAANLRWNLLSITCCQIDRSSSSLS